MSAAQWRRAMKSPAAGVAVLPRAAITTRSTRTTSTTRPAEPLPAHGDLPRWLRVLFRPVRWRHVLVAALVLLYPFFATPFFTFQIGAQSLALGLVALSLTFLGGYGGMVSLAQMTVAGFAAYLVAIIGSSSNAAISLGWPWWLAVIVVLLSPMLRGPKRSVCDRRWVFLAAEVRGR